MGRSAGPPVRTLLVILAAAAFAGCASPRVVRSITSSRDQMKFLYTQGDGQGVVQCKVADDGALSQCHDMQVILEE